MRKLLLVLALSAFVSCQLVEPQYVPMTDAQTTALQTQIGDLSTANAELVRVEASRILGMQVEEVGKVTTPSGEVWVAKLTPPAEEIATEVVTTFWGRVFADPTATGLGAAAMAAMMAGWQAWTRRRTAAAGVPGTKTTETTTKVMPVSAVPLVTETTVTETVVASTVKPVATVGK